MEYCYCLLLPIIYGVYLNESAHLSREILLTFFVLLIAAVIKGNGKLPKPLADMFNGFASETHFSKVTENYLNHMRIRFKPSWTKVSEKTT